jgi:hypothetical protein
VIALKPHDGEVVIRSEAIGLFSSNYTRRELEEASFNEWGCLVSFIASLISQSRIQNFCNMKEFDNPRKAILIM